MRYLAYGSNLCAETFRVNRGIKPLSQINVYVPQLAFDLRLRGIPYIEPCFANVHFREVNATLRNELELGSVDPSRYSDETWDGGLIGVVYEVTHEDYRQIIRTEGGGSGYKEIEIPCVPLQAGKSTAHTQQGEAPARTILAKTLYAADDHLDRALKGESWWKRHFGGRGEHRPIPDHAQPSARYLKLITDGAREHDLPAFYQRYLASLQPYRITTLRQQVGRALTAVLFGVPVLGMLEIAKRLADEDGKYPKPVAEFMKVVFSSVWLAYDCVMKPLFGEGERTESGKGSYQPIRESSFVSKSETMAEEKLELLGE